MTQHTIYNGSVMLVGILYLSGEKGDKKDSWAVATISCILCYHNIIDSTARVLGYVNKFWGGYYLNSIGGNWNKMGGGCMKNGVYDNITTMQRESWWDGACVEVMSNVLIVKYGLRPFGTFPDIERVL